LTAASYVGEAFLFLKQETGYEVMVSNSACSDLVPYFLFIVGFVASKTL
jgi:hypothetical protein